MASISFSTRINVLAASVPTPALTFPIPSSVSLPKNGTLPLAQLVAGGVPPYGSYAVQSGTLPSNVTLAATTGVLTATGSAVVGDTSGLTFRVKDAALTTAISPPVTLKVYDQSSQYPAKGMAKRLSQPFDADSIRPSYMSFTDWGIALYSSQGAGLLNPYYSTNGAYVLAGSGGHEHPTFFGAAVFNFDDFKWSYLECENPGTPRSSKPVYMADTNGQPYLELLVAPGVPAVPHPYRSQVMISPANGGGPLGSMMYLGRGGALGWPVSTGSIHAFDIATRKWRRVTDDRVWGIVEMMALHDPVTNRYYCLTSTPEYADKELYLDGSDWKVKSTAKYTKRNPAVQNGAQQSWIQEGGGVRAIVSLRSNRLFGINLDAFGAGWSEIAIQGTPITVEYATFVEHPVNGVLYRRSNTRKDQSLYRLTPPTGNPLTGTWAHDEIALGGDAIAHYVPTVYGAATHVMNHYRTLMYIPALQMLGWITPNGVFLLNP